MWPLVEIPEPGHIVWDRSLPYYVAWFRNFPKRPHSMGQTCPVVCGLVLENPKPRQGQPCPMPCSLVRLCVRRSVFMSVCLYASTYASCWCMCVRECFMIIPFWICWVLVSVGITQCMSMCVCVCVCVSKSVSVHVCIYVVGRTWKYLL